MSNSSYCKRVLKTVRAVKNGDEIEITITERTAQRIVVRKLRKSCLMHDSKIRETGKNNIGRRPT